MTREGIIEMSMRDLKRLKVVHEALERHITQREAAEIVGLSERQVRRLVKGVREQGDESIVHKARGKRSNRKMPEKVREKVLKLYKSTYRDFGPTLACEKLSELDEITVSRETLRNWLLEAGLWERRRKRRDHRRWRQRKGCFGQMIQMDGSHHDWLEGRGPELVLMGYIDDATNTVFGRFYEYEGTKPAMDSFKRYVRKYGLPQSVYLDRHTTYKSKKKLTIEEELLGQSKPMSQFERALEELGVEVIHAYSPQAKGRVERLFGVLQDRLTKEMRLSGIKTRDEANEFLRTYLPRYNRKFQVKAADEANVHIKLPRGYQLEKYLCLKTIRTVRNDNIISYDGRLFQVENKKRAKKVTVEERLNGSIHIRSNSVELKFKKISQRPEKKAPEKQPKLRKKNIPSQDHPWRLPVIR